MKPPRTLEIKTQMAQLQEDAQTEKDRRVELERRLERLESMFTEHHIALSSAQTDGKMISGFSQLEQYSSLNCEPCFVHKILFSILSLIVRIF